MTNTDSGGQENNDRILAALDKGTPRGTDIPSDRDPTTQDAGDSTRKAETREGTTRQGSPSRQGELFERVSLQQGNGVTGFLGTASEISWMRRTYEHLKQRPSRASATSQEGYLHPDFRIIDALAYYMDEYPLLSIDEDAVGPLIWPHFDRGRFPRDVWCF